jgi:spore germination protein YaaH
MKQKITISMLILSFVLLSGIFVVKNYRKPEMISEASPLLTSTLPQREVIGFLPYWLISKANEDYSKYITNLTYFSLSVAEDGSILKYTNPGESEPGYYALISGKADIHLSKAKEKGLTLSLSVFSGNDETITTMLNNPEKSAKNLVREVTPLMREYGFTELNLDIEQVQEASPDARLRYTNFVKTVRDTLNPKIIKSLSIDVTASSFIKKTNLADPASFALFVDKIIIMAYDYHYMGSYVTGPVAPGKGAGITSEFDTETAIETALAVVPNNKIVLGIPTYGYEWETIGDTPRSAVIAGTGVTISNLRAEEFLASCTSCSAKFDDVDRENYIIYKDQETGTYHQVFYPDEKSTQYKVNLAKTNSLAGMAVWALGYEGATILEPLSSYRN